MPPLISFTPPSSNSWNSLHRCHFCIYIYMCVCVYSICTLFTFLPPFSAISPLYKIKRKLIFLLVRDKDNYTGSFLVLFPWVYVNTWMWLCSLYRNEYRNLKLARVTMGKGLGRSEETRRDLRIIS
jgi:hypothetical protein